MKLIDATPEWADRCREMCRQVYEATFPRPELGITKELFSPAIFSSERIQQYYRDICTNTDSAHSWLAVDDNELIGVVKAVRHDDFAEMKCFYVAVSWQGQGIGHALYQKVLEFTAGLPLQVDVVQYMQDTIDMYEHWGFAIDHTRPPFAYAISEWPPEARQTYRAIYMIKPAA